MKKKLNVMIIGKGFIFSRHVESIKKCGGNVLITVDIDPNKKADFLDYKKAFLSPKFKDVNYIAICTPNDTHKQIIKDCLVTKRIVIVEKPAIIDNNFTGIDGINCVLQLRYHPLINKIKKSLTGKDNIELIIKVYRDKSWLSSWKNNLKRSGGIVMGIMIHQIDFLIFLLGNKYKIIKSYNSKRKCFGVIKWPTATVKYSIEIMNNRIGQTRKFIINGKDFEMSNADNLSYGGWHDRVYRAIINGNGIPLSEARKSIELVLKL